MTTSSNVTIISKKKGRNRKKNRPINPKWTQQCTNGRTSYVTGPAAEEVTAAVISGGRVDHGNGRRTLVRGS